MVELLAKTRDIVLIIAGLAVILFLLLQSGILSIFLPGGGPFGVAQSGLSREQALALDNFNEYSISPECVRGKLGEERFNGVRDGSKPPTQEEKPLLTDCLERESDFGSTPQGVQVGVDYGLLMNGYYPNCANRSIELSLKSFPRTPALSRGDIEFKINGWRVACNGFPETVQAGQEFNCTISQFVQASNNFVELRAPQFGFGSGGSFDCS